MNPESDLTRSGLATVNRTLRFEELYAAHRGRVYGYVLRRAEPDAAGDIIAETFLTAWRRLEEIPAGQEARLWLYAVARRVMANHRRGERRRSELANRLRRELSTVEISEEPTADLDELAAAFSRLSETDREVLALEAWEGLEPGEIAAVLGCSRNAARIRLHRARRRLAQQRASGSPQTRAGETVSTKGGST